MKTFLILLLLTNIVFAMFQWLFPYEQFFSHSRPIVAAEQLRLVHEEQEPLLQPRKNTTVSQQAKTVSTPPPNQKLCYTLGPFKSEKQAQEVVLKAKQDDLRMSTRASTEQEYLGMMVYIEGHENRQEAIDTAESLAGKGIRDYMIVNEIDKSNVLSLGVYGLKKNADRRADRLKQLGYSALLEPRYRDRTIYWLDYNQQETPSLVKLIDELKTEEGVSRISRFCS
jgi:hypothetical protein